MKKAPYIETINSQKTLMVGEKPYRIYGGEIHNSSSSSLQYMNDAVWPALRGMHLNTVIAPVFWETVEPEKGVFDFTLLDGLLNQARRERVRFVLLWFGLWKNAASTYVPAWVQRDIKTYFRVKNEHGKPMMTISPLCGEAVTADAAAFRMMMRHLKEVDGEEQTVIMVQVENEIGVFGAARDFSGAAEEAFRVEIPATLQAAFGKTGSWPEAFGKDACEYFMGYHFAVAIEEIASAGHAEYPLPLYVNAWLEQFPEIPGRYPCGGPIFKLIDLYRLVAPTIELYAPDIYVDQFRAVCDEYAAKGNPLMIPEVRNSIDSVPFLLYAVGAHNAMGFCPFGIEDIRGQGKADAQVLQVLNISEAALGNATGAAELLGHTYELLQNMEEPIRRAHADGQIHAFLEQNDDGIIIPLREIDVKITFNGHGVFASSAPPKEPEAPVAGGFVFETANEIFIMGTGFALEFLPKTGERGSAEIITKEEGRFVSGVWQRGRILNGDERYFNKFGTIPEVMRFQVINLQD